jgi:hypothetical protein
MTTLPAPQCDLRSERSCRRPNQCDQTEDSNVIGNEHGLVIPAYYTGGHALIDALIGTSSGHGLLKSGGALL